jgi:Cupin
VHRVAADALSDVLKTVRLTGAVFFDVVAKAPWVAESPQRDLILPKILPGGGHLIAYHVLTEGLCFANIIGSGRSDRVYQMRSPCLVEQSRHAH